MLYIYKIFKNTTDLACVYYEDYNELSKINVIIDHRLLEHLLTNERVQISYVEYNDEDGHGIWLDDDRYYVFYGKKEDFDEDFVEDVRDASANVIWVY